jgi:hypothetical protein
MRIGGGILAVYQLTQGIICLIAIRELRSRGKFGMNVRSLAFV